MSTPWTKRAPWPWSIELDVGDGTGWHGLMLKPTREGFLTGRLGDFLGNVAPTSYEYGAARPDEETTFVFGRLVGGMGEKVQSSATSKRYHYALGVDCSIAGMPRLGPLFVAETFPGLSAGTGGVRQFVPARRFADTELFALVQTAVYRRDAASGVWALGHDFDPLLPAQATVFQGTAGPGNLWVADGDELWNYDGTTAATWQKATLPAGYACAHVAAVQGELWIAWGAYVATCKDDPLLAASWGGRIQVGDLWSDVTWLEPVGSVMYVFKSDGVYTLNADGSVNELFPELRERGTMAGALVPLGQGATAWQGRLRFPTGAGYQALDPDGGMRAVGPDRLVENDGPVRGAPVSGSGHNDWFFYLAVHNAAANTSYLLKYGTWRPDPGGDAPAAYRFDEVWHGALAVWTGKRVSRIDVVPPLSNQPNATLWVGFLDGTVQWTALPLLGPDPATDAACRFQSAGQLYWPRHDAVFGADKKAFHGFTALGPALSATQSARQYWRTDPALAYAALAPDFTQNGQRVELPDLTTGAARDAATGTQLDTYTELRTTASTATPQLEGMALHEAVRPAAGDPTLHLSWTATVVAANRVVRRDGVLARNRAEHILALARAAAAAAGHVRVRGPDGVVVALAAVEYSQALAPEAGRDGLAHDIAVRFSQYR